MAEKSRLKMPKLNGKRLIIKDFSGLNSAADESVLSMGASADTYNFDFSTGALRGGIGFKDINALSSDITNLWKYNRFSSGEEIVMCSKGTGEVFYLKNGELRPLYGVSVRGKIYAVNYRLYGGDVIIISSDQSPLVVWDGVNSPVTVADSPRIKSMDAYSGRMFVADADGQTVRYTDDLDPTNWNGPISEGGSIKMIDERGRVNRIITFLNYLYVFRDYGISRISFSAGEPVHNGLFVSSGRIYPDTVRLCGDAILFLSEDGIYRFDGLNTKRLLKNLDGFLQPHSGAYAEFSGGKYRLACRAKGGSAVGCESGDYTNNALIVYDYADGSYAVTRGVDVTMLTEADGEVYAVADKALCKLDKSGLIFGTPLHKRWQSPFTDLDSEKTKAFSFISIETAGRIKLTVLTECGEKAFFLEGSKRPQRIRVDLKAKKIALLIESDEADAHICRPMVHYSEIGTGN